MKLDSESILKQIDFALQKSDEIIEQSKYNDCSDLKWGIRNELITLIHATIDRLSPSSSIYRKNAEDILNRFGTSDSRNLRPLSGILKALRTDYEQGHLESINELIHADIFGDFLEMAKYLLEEGYKDPAAVIAGGVIEEHLRKLCLKNGIDTLQGARPKKADAMNAELVKNSVYTKLDQKNITAWLDLRNKAAHGEYNEYTKENVSLMIQGILHFLSTNPA